MGNNFFKKAGKFLIITFGLAYTVIWAIFLFTMPDGYGKYLSLKEKKVKLFKERDFQVRRMERILIETKMLKTSSPYFIEMVARENLKMAKKGETIIKLVENE